MGRKKDQVVQQADGTTIIIREKGGPGCFRRLITWTGGIILLIAILAAALNASQKKQTEDAVDANAGRGTLATPIAAGDWMVFKDGKVKAVRMIRPANAEIEEMNMYNDDVTAGADYVLVWFEVECGKSKCNPRFDMDIHLIDSAGKEWGEPLFIVLDDDLDGAEALQGATVSGWQAFEFPTGQAIQAIAIKWGGTLYTAAPGA